MMVAFTVGEGGHPNCIQIASDIIQHWFREFLQKFCHTGWQECQRSRFTKHSGISQGAGKITDYLLNFGDKNRNMKEV